jgi:catechol 2,3-dioxygenase-like lactoylglutathione lyase family enzyme
MKVYITNVFVDDQDKALKFYTEILGFIKKTEVPAGRYKWLTVVSPEQPEGPEILLEPADHTATVAFRKAIMEDGIPYTSFAVKDIHAELERLKALGVNFTQEPTQIGPAITAVFDDTCGNLIQIAALQQ